MASLNSPMITVITPCYNGARYIAKTIDSVRLQSRNNWEHVVVDDGSTDNTVELVASYAGDDPRLRLISIPNGGVAAARNRGFKERSNSSEFVLFLDADDLIKENMLGVMSGYLCDNPSVDMVHCSFNRIDENGVVKVGSDDLESWGARYIPTSSTPYIRRLGRTDTNTPFVSVFCNPGIIPSASMIRARKFESSGGFDESFGQAYEDTDLFARIALRGRVDHLPQLLTSYRKYDQQHSADGTNTYKQSRKFHKKWLSGVGLNSNEQRLTVAAWWFKQRLESYIGLRASKKYMENGEYFLAAKFALGATRRILLGRVFGRSKKNLLVIRQSPNMEAAANER